jgi:hypothetical protein
MKSIAGYSRAGTERPVLDSGRYAGWPEGRSKYQRGDFRGHCRGEEAQWQFRGRGVVLSW